MDELYLARNPERSHVGGIWDVPTDHRNNVDTVSAIRIAPIVSNVTTTGIPHYESLVNGIAEEPDRPNRSIPQAEIFSDT